MKTNCEQDILSLGLSDEAVKESRIHNGANVLTPAKRDSAWKLYFDKFNDPIIRILLVAAFLSLLLSFIEREFAETIGIFCAIFLATGIGFYFEYDAGKKFDVLNALSDEGMVTVVRHGAVTQITRAEVVVGDIVLLGQGDEVPADGELIEAVSLMVNESSLTGEAVAYKNVKSSMKTGYFKSTYPPYRLYRSSLLVEGHCVMQVTAVGDHTEIGRVTTLSSIASTEDTPLNKQLNRLAGVINKVGFTVAILAFFIFTGHELYFLLPSLGCLDANDWFLITRVVLKNFMMAVTLIVMAVPEGLPMAVTLSLALNMRRMLKTNNLVRKLHACETMGAVTVICTDKTGTLTQNKMQVGNMEYAENDLSLLAELISQNSTAHLDIEHHTGLGNPTEVALLSWLAKKDLDYLTFRQSDRVVNQLPFSTEYKYMATLVDSEVIGKRVLFVKGAPEIVFSYCADKSNEAQLKSSWTGYQERAMRTLGFAYCEVPTDDIHECKHLVERGELRWLGLAAISDPVREDVPEAITKCMEAGVNVKIVTGDTQGTAIEIARQVGLWKEKDGIWNHLTGTEFAALSDKEAMARLSELKVLSRARPTDKQRLVKLLQQRGEVVAVTGDGTNDAPALNFAQVGLSMGSGTAAAKEASDVTLLDDSFGSIVTAILWGRSLYRNIQRFIVFQLTINVAALLTVLVGAFIGAELPLTVTQMLWINLIMDTFAALALASLPADPKLLLQRPRAIRDFILTPMMIRRIMFVGLSFVGVLLWMMIYYAGIGGMMNIWELTVFFTFFVLLQFWNLLNVRVYGSSNSAFSGLWQCKGVLAVLLFIFVGQWLIVQFGGEVFRTVPISFSTWVALILTSSIVLWVGEIARFIQRLRRK